MAGDGAALPAVDWSASVVTGSMTPVTLLRSGLVGLNLWPPKTTKNDETLPGGGSSSKVGPPRSSPT